MAIGTQSKYRLVKLFDTDETIKCGRFKFTNNFELSSIRGYFLLVGLVGATEKFRFKVFSNSTYSKLLYTSEWSLFSDIEGINRTKNSWHGFIRADFNREWINNQFNYYIGCEISNYTRNAFTLYRGIALDTPKPTHKIITSELYIDRPLKIEIFGSYKREL